MTKMKVKEPIVLEDGKHTGTIVRVEERTEPYEYTDVVIKEDSKELELKYGCPTYLSTNSKLGRLLANFTKVEVDIEIDPAEVLKDKRVEFMTLRKKTEKGEFTEIVADSVRPITVESVTDIPEDKIKKVMEDKSVSREGAIALLKANAA